MNKHRVQIRGDFADGVTCSSHAERQARTSFPACSFNGMTRSPLENLFISTTPTFSIVLTTRCSIVAFAVSRIVLWCVGSLTCNLTCRRVAPLCVDDGGWLEIAAHVGLFEVVEIVGGVVAIDEVLPSLQTAL